MIRFCQKEDCDKQTIKRGKYCIDHCTIRKKSLFDIKTDDEILEEIRNKRRYDDENRIFQQNKIIEDRLIMEEQNREYNETYNRDLEIKKQKDENERKEIHDKQKFTNEMNEKIHSNSHRENDEYYKIKFVFPNLSGLSIISTFSKDDYFKNIFDFVDVFLYDLNINCAMYDYELISYPRIILEKKEDYNVKISDKISTRNIQLTYKEIEKNDFCK